MKTNIKITTTILTVFLFCGFGFAQDPMLGPIPSHENGVLDGVYVQEHIPTKKVINYTHVREADVIWSKRLWRVIDLREKINHPLYYPLEPLDNRWAFWSIIRFYLENEPGALTAYLLFDYDAGTFNLKDGDQFKYPLKWDPALGPERDSVYQSRLKSLLYVAGEEPTTPLQTTPDPITGETFDSIKPNGEFAYPEREYYEVEPKDIVEYHIKEDWFFDKQRSVMDVRIIGIAPVVYEKTPDPATGQEKVTGKKELFWLYFPQLRHIMQNYFVYNRKNDARRMSFDDLFWKRMFNSYVYKSSNVYDRDIDTYKTGVDALLESEEIKKELFIIEHDVWHF